MKTEKIDFFLRVDCTLKMKIDHLFQSQIKFYVKCYCIFKDT